MSHRRPVIDLAVRPNGMPLVHMLTLSASPIRRPHRRSAKDRPAITPAVTFRVRIRGVLRHPMHTVRRLTVNVDSSGVLVTHLRAPLSSAIPGQRRRLAIDRKFYEVPRKNHRRTFLRKRRRLVRQRDLLPLNSPGG
jgi:hypothetical protein